MSTTSTMVIVGASLAAATAASTLRTEGFDGRILLLAEEPELPYERPSLSKGYLTGNAPRAQVHLHEQGFYAEHDIDLRTGTRADELDLAAGQVALQTGERLRFDRLLLATGAAPRRLQVPGADLAGIHYLRTSPTRTRCASGSPRAAGWWWSGRAGSAWRSPARHGSWAWT